MGKLKVGNGDICMSMCAPLKVMNGKGREEKVWNYLNNCLRKTGKEKGVVVRRYESVRNNVVGPR